MGADLTIHVWVVEVVVAFACVWEVQSVWGAEQNLALSDAANFLDAGLTALGLLTALVITVMRGRLDSENNTRDLLALLAGRKVSSVKMLLQSHLQITHSLSTALVLVEHNSLVWAEEMLLYYGAVTGKTVDLISAKWLHPDNYPASHQTDRCKCPGGPLRCKCLLFLHVEGVAEHLVAVAQGGIFKVDDEYDALISQSCRRFKCHGFASTVYQPGAASFGPPPPLPSDAEAALCKCIADLNVEEEGKTGLVLLEPADSNSVEWWDTILQASLTKDASERGSENPFTQDYNRVLQGKDALGVGRHEMNDAPWWLSRVGAFLLSSTLVLLFRTDAFSSILLARRALRGYMLDTTGTKLPLEFFCKVAQCEGVAGERKAFVVFKPKDNFILRYPHRALWTGVVFEAVVVLLWFSTVALTPWFHPAGASYIEDGHNWTMALGGAIAVLSSCINAWWWFREKPADRRKWALVASLCGAVDAGIVTLAVLWICHLAHGHALATGFRCLMLIAALLQWGLGVDTLGALTSAFRGQTTKIIIPYSLTYLRLLALVAGAGSWA